MEPLNQTCPPLYTPSSENDRYFGYYRGTIGIYPCHPCVSRDSLMNHIRNWLDDEIGTPPRQFRRISFYGRTVRELTQPRESGVDFVNRQVPRSWYGGPEKEEKITAMNLGGLALVAANKVVGGTRDARTAGLIAISDGPAKELLVPMARYRKAEPCMKRLDSTVWSSLHSLSADLVDWGKSISDLQDAGMVARERCATWGLEQRSEPWARRKGPVEHAWRIIFVGLYDELLKAVEEFRESLPLAAEEIVKKEKKVRFELEGDQGEGGHMRADEHAKEQKDGMETEP